MKIRPNFDTDISIFPPKNNLNFYKVSIIRKDSVLFLDCHVDKIY